MLFCFVLLETKKYVPVAQKILRKMKIKRAMQHKSLVESSERMLGKKKQQLVPKQSSTTTTTTDVTNKTNPAVAMVATLKTSFGRVATISDTKADPESVLVELSDGHSLVQLKRTRVKGFCVECIKRKGDPNFRKTMSKITTYCPKCPGGNWICTHCFEATHDLNLQMSTQ